MKYIVGFLLLAGSVASFGQKQLARPDIPGDLMIDVGLNYWDEEPLFIDQAGWRSKSISFYYVKRKALNDKFSFYYGVGLGLEKIGLGDSLTFSSGVLLNGDDNNPDNDGISPLELTSLSEEISYDKNRLAVTYLDVPIDFRFHPKGTQDGEGLFLGVGGIVGLRLNSHMKYKFDENDETVIEKVKGGYNLSTFRYGVQARVGFKGVHLFYKQYFNDMFKDPIGSASPRMTTIGINLTGF